MGHLIVGIFLILTGLLNLYFWHDLEMRKDKKETLPTTTTIYNGIMKGEWIETYQYNGMRSARYYRNGEVYFASNAYYQGDDK